MAKVITAIFTNQSKALRAVDDLIAHEYAERDISLLMSGRTQGWHFTIAESTKANKGLAIGAAVLGPLCALIFGLMSVGMIAAPVVAVYASGQVISALAGFGFGALMGGLIGGLIGLTMPEHRAEFCAAIPKEGDILLGVISSNPLRTDEAVKLIQSNGATHVRTDNVKAEEKSEDSEHIEAA